MVEIVKVNDTTVAKVGTQEVRQIYTATQLAQRREHLEAQLAEVVALQEALK